MGAPDSGPPAPEGPTRTSTEGPPRERSNTLGSHPLTSPTVQRPGAAVLAWWAGIRADALDAWMSPMVRKGTMGAMAITIGSFTPAFLPTDSHVLDVLGMPWMASLPGAWSPPAWCSLGSPCSWRPGSGCGHGPAAPLLPAVIWALWSLPLLIAPPLFSRDAYSYAAQGHIVEMSWDPYSVGPFFLAGQLHGPGRPHVAVHPRPVRSPRPAGPAPGRHRHGWARLPGRHRDAGLGLLAVALIAYALPRLAENVGVNRNHAVWLGVLNPLVILHLVGGPTTTRS